MFYIQQVLRSLVSGALFSTLFDYMSPRDWDMRLGRQPYYKNWTLNEIQTDNIWSMHVQVIKVSWVPSGAQKINYTQNNCNEFNFMET